MPADHVVRSTSTS